MIGRGQQIGVWLSDHAVSLLLSVFIVGLLVYLLEWAVAPLTLGQVGRFLLRSLRRNVLRTGLTCVAIMVLVFVMTMIWSVLYFLSRMTEDKAKDLKAIVTEKYQIPSQMPFRYASDLTREALSLPPGLRPKESDLMTWQFYGGTLDPTKRTRENVIFFFAMEPSKLRTMMDDLEELDEELVRKLEQKRDGAILGREKLAAMNKRVGERFKVTSLNYKEIDLEFEIVGVFPEGRYNQSAVMNRDYLLSALDEYKYRKGVAHPMAERTLNLFWMRLPSSRAFEEVAAQISMPGKFAAPAVKCETASSGIASWLDAYRDLIWGMRFLLSPAIIATMALVIANAISISVRERRAEMAVLKVLGFAPAHVLVLVLGEALLIGAVSGLVSCGLTYVVVNHVIGGFKFPIAFFPAFFVPWHALWWGPAVGGLTAAIGSFLPAWTARSVKVSEVFAKVG
ncbi:MAG: ABC transporter permease [Gemmataceae bacterium]|nr:ABC transporter permease [Gemmataceae bacterium]MDW8265545.1 ABC transporter permease [Gemmataceae bacterium]